MRISGLPRVLTKRLLQPPPHNSAACQHHRTMSSLFSGHIPAKVASIWWQTSPRFQVPGLKMLQAGFSNTSPSLKNKIVKVDTTKTLKCHNGNSKEGKEESETDEDAHVKGVLLLKSKPGDKKQFCATGDHEMQYTNKDQETKKDDDPKTGDPRKYYEPGFWKETDTAQVTHATQGNASEQETGRWRFWRRDSSRQASDIQADQHLPAVQHQQPQTNRWMFLNRNSCGQVSSVPPDQHHLADTFPGDEQVLAEVDYIPPESIMAKFRRDLENVRNMPIPALVFGLAGLVPFVAPPLYMLYNTHTYIPSYVMAQRLYGACILSFLGGMRWGFVVSKDSEQQPDLVNLGYSVIPPVVAWGALMLPVNLGLLVIMNAIALTAFFDVAMSGYPPWFKVLRSLLSICVVLALWTSYLCYVALNEAEPEIERYEDFR